MLLHRSKIYEHKYGLFTNAPLSWCENLFFCLEEDLFDNDENVIFVESKCTCDFCQKINNVKNTWKTWEPISPIEKAIKNCLHYLE